MTRLAAFIFISISFVQHSFVHAAEVIAEDDVTIRQSNGNQGQGSLLLKHDSSSGSSSNRAAWFKFDLTGLDADSDASAEFEITFQTSGASGLFELEAFGLNSGFAGTTDWSEGTLAWASPPPGASSNLHSVSSDMTSLGTTNFTLSADSEVSFTITNLGDFIQTDNTLTLALFSNTYDGSPLAFYSKESAGAGQSPTLTYAVIPEPGSLMLMFSGLIGLYLLKRRS